jgi:hypothetical protein
MAPALPFSMSKWQATSCPSATVRRRGRFDAPVEGVAHRGWNGQKSGSTSRSGGLPSMLASRVVPSESADGIAASSPRV